MYGAAEPPVRQVCVICVTYLVVRGHHSKLISLPQGGSGSFEFTAQLKTSINQYTLHYSAVQKTQVSLEQIFPVPAG